jgi:mRNA interferase MazF
VTFDRHDVVVVPFPFTDRDVRLRRPAVVLSDRAFADKTGQHLLAMITRAERSTWPGDLAVSDQQAAGLGRPSVVRLKLFTLVTPLILDRLGKLGKADAQALARRLADHLDLAETSNR